ncbi:MAG: hypothetical protein ACK4SY_09445, partial [Pyrobaculum sp.]
RKAAFGLPPIFWVGIVLMFLVYLTARDVFVLGIPLWAWIGIVWLLAIVMSRPDSRTRRR